MSSSAVILELLPKCLLFHIFDDFMDWKDIAHLDIALCNRQLRNQFLSTLSTGGMFHTNIFAVSDDSLVYLQNRQVKVQHLVINTRLCSLSTLQALYSLEMQSKNDYLHSIVSLSVVIDELPLDKQTESIQYTGGRSEYILLPVFWILKIINACTNLQRLHYKDYQQDYSNLQIHYLQKNLQTILFNQVYQLGRLKELAITRTCYFTNDCIVGLMNGNPATAAVLQHITIYHCQQLHFALLCTWFSSLMHLQEVVIDCVEPMTVGEELVSDSMPLVKSSKCEGVKRVGLYGPGITLSMIYTLLSYVLPLPTTTSTTTSYSNTTSNRRQQHNVKLLFIEYADLLQKIYNTSHTSHTSTNSNGNGNGNIPSLLQLLSTYYPNGQFHFYSPQPINTTTTNNTTTTTTNNNMITKYVIVKEDDDNSDDNDDRKKSSHSHHHYHHYHTVGGRYHPHHPHHFGRGVTTTSKVCFRLKA